MKFTAQVVYEELVKAFEHVNPNVVGDYDVWEAQNETTVKAYQVLAGRLNAMITSETDLNEIAQKILTNLEAIKKKVCDE